jgi:hypothetical protein
MSRPVIKMKQHYANSIVGKTVKLVRELNDEEMNELLWYESSNPTCIIEFTDNTLALVMADPEGNGTGFLELFTE